MIRILAIAGNALIALWIIFNAIDSGFRGTGPGKVAFIFLLLVLALNIKLLYKSK